MSIVKKSVRWMALTVLLHLLAACAAANYEPYAPSSSPPPPPPAPVAAAPAMAYRSAPAPVALYGVADVSQAKPAPAAQRKVHYEGAINLVATQPVKVIEQAVDWVRQAGGYVESLTGQQVVLQIPAARFRPLYDQMLGLGDVVDKSLSARDVTEEFLDVDMRLAQAKATRDRLLALIQKAQDHREKLRLLREVERLSSEIESLESQMARLRTLVDYSRLTLNVEGRKAFEGRAPQEPRGFNWMAALATARPLDGDAVRFALAVPVGMVDLSTAAQLWSAASPDGVTLATQQRRNEPRGATRFWADALQARLKDRFAQVEQKAAGDFTVLRLTSQDEPRFVYWIAVATKDEKLFVAQAYFPSLDHERRFGEAVLASLKGGVK
ncbi:MAG: DUF4349 domain-containing protein [Pseudomonadota bacterium]